MSVIHLFLARLGHLWYRGRTPRGGCPTAPVTLPLYCFDPFATNQHHSSREPSCRTTETYV